MSNFFSAGEGAYQISALTAAVRHPLDESRDVFRKIGTRKYSENQETWAKLTKQEKEIYLLETHECAHHGLLHSTPLGLFLWRINQVVSRDVAWLIATLRKIKVELPWGPSPAESLTSKSFRRVLAASPLLADGLKDELLNTITDLANVVHVQDVIYGHDPTSKYSDLTRSNFVEALNRAFHYMAKRCDLSWSAQWKSREAEARIFPADAAYNARAVMETHAISRELYILMKYNDWAGVAQRKEAARSGSFGASVERILALASDTSDLGFSATGVQILVTLVCSSRLELTAAHDAKELFLEDHLPWLILRRGTVTNDQLRESLAILLHVTHQKFFGPGSMWLQYCVNRATQDPSMILQHFTTLGLDWQLQRIHDGMAAHLRYLVACSNSDQMADRVVAMDDWTKAIFRSVLVIEYSDGLWCEYEEMEKIYPPDSPVWEVADQMLTKHRFAFMIGNILQGAITTRMCALWKNQLTGDPESFLIKLGREMDYLKKLGWPSAHVDRYHGIAKIALGEIFSAQDFLYRTR